MNETHLLLAMAERRIKFAGDRIRFTKGAASPELIQQIREAKDDVRYWLCLIQQAYPDGVPAQVPIETCRMCGEWYPCVPVTFKDGSEGTMCVACYLREIAPDVNRSRCEVCEAPIVGGHRRDLFGGIVICNECFRVKLPQDRVEAKRVIQAMCAHDVIRKET